MPLTYLQIVQQAGVELGLFSTLPATVAGSQDQMVLQMGALANRIGSMLESRYDWTALQTEYPISIGAPLSLTGNLTTGSAVVTGLASTAGITANNFAVSGTGITTGTRVLSIDSATQITLNQPATATATATPLSIVQDTFAVPADFSRYIGRTMWDRTQRWELIGPMSPQEYQWVVSGIVSTGPRRRWRQIGRGQNVFRIWPPPTSSGTPAQLVFEYVSNYWATAANGTPKEQFTLDGDTSVFDDHIMVMGVKWLYFQAKGYEYAALKQDWEQNADAVMARDGGNSTLSLDRRRFPIFISPANVQDVNFPGPS